MSIRKEPLSELLEKYVLIMIELQRLNALLVHYSESGVSAKVAQAADSIKRLELSKKTIALELDRRMPNADNPPTGTEDGSSPSS